MTKPTAEDPEGQALARPEGSHAGKPPRAGEGPRWLRAAAWTATVGPGAGGPPPAGPRRAWLRLAPFSPFPTALSIEECRHRRISPGACPGGTVTSVMGFTLQVQPS